MHKFEINEHLLSESFEVDVNWGRFLGRLHCCLLDSDSRRSLLGDQLLAQRLVCDPSQCSSWTGSGGGCLSELCCSGSAICLRCVFSAQPSRIGCVSWTPPEALSWELDGQHGLTAPRLPHCSPLAGLGHWGVCTPGSWDCWLYYTSPPVTWLCFQNVCAFSVLARVSWKMHTWFVYSLVLDATRRQGQTSFSLSSNSLGTWHKEALNKYVWVKEC